MGRNTGRRYIAHLTIYQSRGIGREEIQTAIGDDQLQELGGVMEPELGVEEEVLTGSIE